MKKLNWHRSAMVLVGVGLLLAAGLHGTALAQTEQFHHGTWGGWCGSFGDAPELDPGAIRSGLALLVGTGLMIVDRFRRRS